MQMGIGTGRGRVMGFVSCTLRLGPTRKRAAEDFCVVVRVPFWLTSLLAETESVWDEAASLGFSHGRGRAKRRCAGRSLSQRCSSLLSSTRLVLFKTQPRSLCLRKWNIFLQDGE